MDRIIDKKITGYICLVSVVFFTGIILYSIIPNLITSLYEKPITFAFYWANITTFFYFLLLLVHRLIVHKPTAILIRNISFLIIGVGIFQIINCFISIHDAVWIAISFIAIVTILLTFSYGSRKFQ